MKEKIIRSDMLGEQYYEIKHNSGLTVLAAIAAEIGRSRLPADAVTVRLGGAREMLREADAAVVASGTATLEAALAGCPTVLVYHVDLLFEVICRFTLKGVKHIGLINIVCEKTGETVPYPMPELIQQDFTVGNVLKHLRPWLTDDAANASARAALAAAADLLRHDGDPIAEIANRLVGDEHYCVWPQLEKEMKRRISGG